MKIEFDDKSYLEVEHSKSPGKIQITIGAKNYENPLQTIINSVDIDLKQFNQIIESLGLKNK